MNTKTPTLPTYAFPERSPRADSEHDLLASFSRSGLTEARFSKKELGRVLEVAAALWATAL